MKCIGHAHTIKNSVFYEVHTSLDQKHSANLSIFEIVLDVGQKSANSIFFTTGENGELKIHYEWKSQPEEITLLF